MSLSAPLLSQPGQSSSSLSKPIGRAEKIVLYIGFLLILGLKLVYPFVLRFDSDEPQHLHVVWGWARGLLQYRDVFDNHAPLFHILNAPLFWALGERANIVVPMRFAMIPLCAITLWCVYRIGLALYGRRAALWSALATAVVPVYFFTASEFRTDDLWIVFWMASLLALVSGNSPSLFWAGLLMGCGFASSMKTSLLVGCLLAASLFVAGFLFLDRRARLQPEAQKGQPAVAGAILAGMLRAILGLLIVPALIVGFFWFKGAYKEFYYCVIQHNVVPGMGNSKLGLHSLRLPIALPFLLAAGFALYRFASNPSLGARRSLLFLTGGIYLFALRSYWPLITAQDYLPFIPLVCLVATPLFLAALDRTQLKFLQIGGPTAAFVVLIGMTIVEHPFWVDDTRKQVDMIRDVLALTTPDEPLMDGKGETIFRKRPFYYVLEGITIERMRRGLIPNTIVQDLIKSQTAVIHISRLQGDAPAFVQANYLPVHNLQVLGQMLNKTQKDSGASYSFQVVVPSDYDLVAPSGPLRNASGGSGDLILDGSPFSGPRRLEAGIHELQVGGSHGPIALFWAKALQRGYTPFNL